MIAFNCSCCFPVLVCVFRAFRMMDRRKKSAVMKAARRLQCKPRTESSTLLQMCFKTFTVCARASGSRGAAASILDQFGSSHRGRGRISGDEMFPSQALLEVFSSPCKQLRAADPKLGVCPAERNGAQVCANSGFVRFRWNL